MLVARAPRPGLNLNFTSKNILLAVMALLFAALFFYDGYHGYPARNDRTIEDVKTQKDANPNTKMLADSWKGWDNETEDSRQRMDAALHADTHIRIGEWKSPFDVSIQHYISWALIGVNLWTLWRLIHFMRLRATADESMLSPAKGVSIPWEKITKVDNTEWDSYGIVKLTYTDGEGKAQQAELDEYKLEKESLLAILGPGWASRR